GIGQTAEAPQGLWVFRPEFVLMDPNILGVEQETFFKKVGRPQGPGETAPGVDGLEVPFPLEFQTGRQNVAQNLHRLRVPFG
ncbi:MAG: hypothetical protein VX581_04565, partial [Chloroflexota bacterium]|nr:hypothetical protein [Chloroflexota bacterium]